MGNKCWRQYLLHIVKDLDDHTMKFNIDYKFDWYGEEGNGFKEYYYSSPSNYPNEKEKLLNKTNEILARNSQYPGIAYTDNDIRRGKLLK